MRSDSPYYNPQIETLPRDQIEQLQEGLLLQLLPFAYSQSPLISEVWQEAGVSPAEIKSLADFREKAPFTDKDAIRRYRDSHSDPFGGLLCSSTRAIRSVGFTSGTTGDPTPLPFIEPLSAEAFRRDYWQMGMRPGDYYLQPLFTFREGINSNRYRGVDFRTIAVQHSMDQAWRIIEASIQFRPKVMNPVSTPLLMAIEEECQKRNIDIHDVFSSYKAVVFGGEPPSPRIQALIKSWGVDMYQLTSLGDITSANDCSAHAGFHAWEDIAFIECLLPGTNIPAADGERGELVVTALQDQVAPLIRYRTDDLITFTRKPCACGRTHGRFEVLGRLGDQMLIQGKSILPRDVMPLVESVPETIKTLFQIIARAKQMEQLELRVGYEPELLKTSEEELRNRLTQLISASLEVPVTIELVVNAELLKLGPPHKIPRVSKH